MCFTMAILYLFQDGMALVAETMGRIASYYYLSHKSMSLFYTQLAARSTLEELLLVLSVSRWRPAGLGMGGEKQ